MFFTSDTHFMHPNILLKFQPNRAQVWPTLDDMNEGLIYNWNQTVGHSDDVYHLGDCSFGSPEKTLAILRRLNGRKHFVWGNHDKVMDRPEILELFETVQHYKELRVGNRHLVLFHFPMHAWHKNHRGSIHLHGHCHGSLPPLGKRVDVGIDSPYVTGQHEHRPLHLDEILAWADRQEIVVVDHHKP